MLILQALILGIVQGLTEFIPISSSAHLILLPWLFKWNDEIVTSLSFDVALHLGTLLALLSYFAADWVRLIKAWWASVIERRVTRGQYVNVVHGALREYDLPDLAATLGGRLAIEDPVDAFGAPVAPKN